MKQISLQVVLGALVGVVCGCASALFLTMLEWVTATRVADERWVWALPLGGLAIGLVCRAGAHTHRHTGSLASAQERDVGVKEPGEPAPRRPRRIRGGIRPVRRTGTRQDRQPDETCDTRMKSVHVAS